MGIHVAENELPGGLTWHQGALIIAGIFSIPALLLSIFVIVGHLRHYTSPKVQRFIVRIVLMVPIYVIDSYLSLWLKNAAIYLIVTRDIYEAYLLYIFFRLMVELSGGDEGLIAKMEMLPQLTYAAPLCCFHVKPGRIFLHRCRQMILQYVVIKPILAITVFVTELCGVYKEGDYSPHYAYLYVTIVYNISIFLSLYFLFMFYEATKQILAPYRPVLKFLCIKAVIFFSFWQGLLVAGLITVGWFAEETDDWSVEDISRGVQNFVLCIELLPLSIAFYYAFGHSQFKRDQNKHSPIMLEEVPQMVQIFVTSVVNLKDTVDDTALAMKRGPPRNIKAGDFLDAARQLQLDRAVYQGWLEKRGEDLAKFWKLRYFLLLSEPKGLIYFKRNPFIREAADDHALKARGFISFQQDISQQSIIVRENFRFSIATPSRKWHFRAKSEEERQVWLDQVNSMLPASVEA